MESLQIKLFERFELQYGDFTLTGLGSNKAQELFCYLLLHRNRSFLRENLAEFLWGKDSGIHNKKNMRQAVWEIQSALKPHANEQDLRLLLASTDRVQIAPELSYELDAARLECAFNTIHTIPAADLTEKHIEAIRKVEAIYRGDLLEGCYWDWCTEKREHYKEMYLTALEKMMIHAELNGQYEIGIAYGNRILNHDRLIESAHQHLMRLYYLAGYRIKAIRQYERCVAILQQELGVQPSQETIWLSEQIKADTLSYDGLFPNSKKAAFVM